MRITNRMLVDNVLRNLNRNLAQLQKTQYQQSSGKKVSRPSDDPIRVTQALYMRSALSEQQQHIKNMKDAKSWLDATDTALMNAGEIIHRAYELAVGGANDTLPEDARRAIADEIDQLIDHLVQVANTSHTGRYIFAGSRTADIPFEYDDPSNPTTVNYNGNSNNLDWEVSPGVTMTVNLTGENVFNFVDKNGDLVNVFDILFDLRDALYHDPGISEPSQVIQTSITKLQEALDHNLSQRSIVGAKSRRMELAIARAEEAEINSTEILSNLEDIDIAEVNMMLSMHSYVYQAALMTGVKVLQPSLLDFLK
ncbi:MAG TPA: flagellar hook-associated protein FlgL [Clostridia bacterium]|nr:flagellar hook-associated protein FlgL [Clostridia bacterium]